MRINVGIVHLVVLYAIAGTAAGLVLMNRCSTLRTAYVDAAAMYNDFTLKKELEKKLTATAASRKAVLDSLMFDLKMLSENMKRNPTDQQLAYRFEQRRQNYLEREQMLNEDNERQSKEYDKQIWTQLNQYVKDYGEQEGYDYIYGADGSGRLMYAAESRNITDELKEYTNQRYAGK